MAAAGADGGFEVRDGGPGAHVQNSLVAMARACGGNGGGIPLLVEMVGVDT